jgi:exocyst complex component 3
MELINCGLVGNEYVTLLSWIKNTYNGPDMMMNPELYINTSSIGPLLESEVVASLEGQYLKVRNYCKLSAK